MHETMSPETRSYMTGFNFLMVYFGHWLLIKASVCLILRVIVLPGFYSSLCICLGHVGVWLRFFWESIYPHLSIEVNYYCLTLKRRITRSDIQSAGDKEGGERRKDLAGNPFG